MIILVRVPSKKGSIFNFKQSCKIQPKSTDFDSS
jgi:hypothetical protein